MRMFIAIDCNKERSYFCQLQGLLPKEGVRPADDFHITLKFLGEVIPAKAEKVKGALRGVEFAPFSFSLASIGCFPNENNPRVVWVGVEPKDHVTELQHQIEKALGALFQKDKRFEPHITLARIKDNKGNGNNSNATEKTTRAMIEKKAFEVSEFRLMKSMLTSAGPVYEPILSIRAKPSRGNVQNFTK